MARSILVTYATQYGSTEDIAQRIASVLEQDGHHVDFVPVGDVQWVNKHDAIFLGAPIYFGKWHKDAHRFLKAYAQSLMHKQLFIFAPGPLHKEPEEMASAGQALENTLNEYPWLTPAATRIFIGKYNPTDLKPMHRIVAAMPSPIHGLPPTDNRDWREIEEWAHQTGQLVRQKAEENTKQEPSDDK